MEELITTKDAAALLGVTPRYVRRLVQHGRLALIREIGGGYIVSRESVERYREERRGPGRPATTRRT